MSRRTAAMSASVRIASPKAIERNGGTRAITSPGRRRRYAKMQARLLSALGMRPLAQREIACVMLVR